MSTFERDEYKWRETYFVMFESARRPTLKCVEKALSEVNDRFQLSEGIADEEGRFESLTLLSPDDYAAVDISFDDGEEVREQGESLYKELKSSVTEPDERKKLERIPQLDARFDLMHFEQVSSSSGEDIDDMLDPSALLIVMDALVELTKGVGIDPQSGTIM